MSVKFNMEGSTKLAEKYLQYQIYKHLNIEPNTNAYSFVRCIFILSLSISLHLITVAMISFLTTSPGFFKMKNETQTNIPNQISKWDLSASSVRNHSSYYSLYGKLEFEEVIVIHTVYFKIHMNNSFFIHMWCLLFDSTATRQNSWHPLDGMLTNT